MHARYDLIIVGMGSGGIVAAEFATTLGVRVAVVERERIGGDCLWTGCVPSKALLAAAKAAHAMRNADALGLTAIEPRIDTASVLERVRAVQREIAAHDDNPDRFAALGVEFHWGPARLTGPHTVAVGNDEQIDGRYVLLCTGSRPAVPAIEGLEGAGFVTSETVWELERAPSSLIAIGGGPVAIELSQAFTRLGCPTIALEQAQRVLQRDEPELVETLVARLRAEGVELELDVAIERVAVEDAVKVVSGTQAGAARTWRADELLVATGRRPHVDGLGLEQLGIEVGPRGVAVDARARTAVKSIYAVGDLTGRLFFTHSAAYEAARAVRNMFFPGSARGPALVPWTTFTDPELAHVGMTTAQAREAHGDVEVWRHDLAHSDRARTEAAGDGAIVVVTASGRVVGAHALAPAAGELIHELALAVHQRLKLAELASMVHVYPTLATGIGQLAGEAAYARARRYRRLVRSSA